jgi:uncharacterized membrane protein SpoIIM required for sporulation
VKREPFVAARSERWSKLQRLIDGLRRRKSVGGTPEFPRLYRQVCQDLALARRRMYGRELALDLNQLALDGREQLYRPAGRFLPRILDFFLRGFPRLVRGEAKLFWLAAALYVVPLAAMIVYAHTRPEVLYAVLDPEQVAEFEEMYDPADTAAGGGRESGSDVAMFGFYIMNNVGADFRFFAGGLAWGLGTILLLVFNGLFHGAVFGHLMHIGYDSTLFPFIIGHASFELTAMLISSAAGLRLGHTVLAPGRRTRTRALREVGSRCLLLLLGAAAMTMIAAFIEGFWSPSAAPIAAKFAVAGVLWTSVTVYFLFAGRGDGS